jgi:hypothetical protein
LGGSWFQANLGQKVCENPILPEKIWAWWCAPAISAIVKSIKRKDHGWENVSFYLQKGWMHSSSCTVPTQ